MKVKKPKLTPKERSILEAFIAKGGKATVLEVYKALGDSSSKQTFYRAVGSLEKKGYLEYVASKGQRSTTGGRPEKIYIVRMEPEPDLKLPLFVETHEQVETKHIKEETEGKRPLFPEEITPPFGEYVPKQRDVFRDIAQGWVEGALRPDLPEILRRAAEALSKENPITLYLDFAEWIYKEYQEASDAYRRAGRHDRMTEARRRMESLKRLCDRVFTRGLGIPAEKEIAADGKARGPLRLSFNFQNLEDNSIFRKSEVENFLRRALIGEYVIEVTAGDSIKFPLIAAGTDTSRYEVLLYPSERAQIIFEPFPVSIITALFVRHDYKEQGFIDYDAEPEPIHWRHYNSEKAIDKGLVIPPEFYEELPGMHARLREAAMDLRHYAKDWEALKADKAGKVTDVDLRDGRIFPLEHRFSDCLQSTRHGHLVRKSLMEFYTIVKGMEKPFSERRIYCGIVKQPVLGVLASIVLWYLKYGSKSHKGTSLWPDMSDEYIFGAPTSDRKIALTLLGLLPPVEPGQYRTTCRFIRPFYSLMEHYHKYFKDHADLIGKTDDVDGLKSLVDFLKDKVNESNTDLSEVDVDSFAWLCMHAATASFYAVGPDAACIEVLPKYEYLVPPDIFRSGHEEIKEKDEKVMKRLLPILLHPEMLEQYVEDLDSEGKLRLPKPVCDAHEWAKDIGRIYKYHVEDLLFETAVRVAREKFNVPAVAFSPGSPQRNETSST